MTICTIVGTKIKNKNIVETYDILVFNFSSTLPCTIPTVDDFSHPSYLYRIRSFTSRNGNFHNIYLNNLYIYILYIYRKIINAAKHLVNFKTYI